MSYYIKILPAVFIALFFAACGSKQEIIYPKHTKSSSSAVHRATMRPYSVNGVTYYPTVVNEGEKFRGTASWYGPNFHGKKTSSGEVYDMYERTAAHKTLPMNTLVKVTNLSNGKSTVVRINDRGPFVANRIIDLSYAAAKDISMVGRGTAPVEIEILGFDDNVKKLYKPGKTQVVLSNYAVQIGAFRRYAGAKITSDKNAMVDGRYKAVVKKFIYQGEPIYRVWLTGFQSEAEARDFIEKSGYPGAFVIRE